MTEHVFTLTQMREAIRRVELGGHSVFAPSASKMWLGCSGSLIPNLFAPDDAGEDAAYGTVGHAVGEEWLKTLKRPKHLIGTSQYVPSGELGFLIEIDEVMLDYVKRYVDWCKHLPGRHFVETRVDFSVLTPIPNQGGTADHVACMPGRMVITDLKMGKGVKVFAEGNTQAMLYALGFFLKWDWLYDFEDILIRIAQPRLDHWDEWLITREQLLEFAEYVKVRAAAAWVQNAPRTPSAEACQWCRVQANCSAKAKVVFDLAEGVFDDLAKTVSVEEADEFRGRLDFKEFELADPMSLTTLEMEQIYEWRGSVERYFLKIHEELMKRAQRGMKLKMQKLVESRSHRAFRNKDRTVAKLLELGLKREDILTEELPSPAQVEEMLRKKLKYTTKMLEGVLEDVVIRPPGKATLAPMSDKRPPFGSNDGDVFSDLAKPTNRQTDKS
jgi:hypothetical protein